MHSPVWDYHPSFDTADVWSDWEYYSDDYYDEESIATRRKPSLHKVKASGPLKRKSGGDICAQGKKRKIGSIEELPSALLDGSSDSTYSTACSPGSVVRWKKEIWTNSDVPVSGNVDLEPVALLKDWRSRFGVHANTKSQRSHTKLGKMSSRSQSSASAAVSKLSLQENVLGRSEEFSKPHSKLDMHALRVGTAKSQSVSHVTGACSGEDSPARKPFEENEVTRNRDFTGNHPRDVEKMSRKRKAYDIDISFEDQAFGDRGNDS